MAPFSIGPLRVIFARAGMAYAWCVIVSLMMFFSSFESAVFDLCAQAA